jgi:hypothetical protein
MSDTIRGILRIPKDHPRIHQTKPFGAMFDGPLENPNLVIGIELEIENVSSDVVANIDEQFWSAERDYSLRPVDESYEFISKPAPTAIAIPNLIKFFNQIELDENNYSDRTSVHIHTNVLDFTVEQFTNLVLVYPIFEKVLFQFVNFYNTTNRYGYSRDTNLYCVPWGQCLIHKRVLNTIKRSFKGEVALSWQKYTALNVVPMWDIGTVEWRHMHGTNNVDKLVKWINIIGSIMKYAGNTPHEEVCKVLHRLNDDSAYQQFFKAVLSDTLPYTDEYAQLMAQGVILAKYGMITGNGAKEARVTATIPPNSVFGVSALNEIMFQEAEAVVQYRNSVAEMLNNNGIRPQEEHAVNPAPPLRYITDAEEADMFEDFEEEDE